MKLQYINLLTNLKTVTLLHQLTNVVFVIFTLFFYQLKLSLCSTAIYILQIKKYLSKLYEYITCL